MIQNIRQGYTLYIHATGTEARVVNMDLGKYQLKLPEKDYIWKNYMYGPY